MFKPPRARKGVKYWYCKIRANGRRNPNFYRFLIRVEEFLKYYNANAYLYQLSMIRGGYNSLNASRKLIYFNQFNVRQREQWGNGLWSRTKFLTASTLLFQELIITAMAELCWRNGEQLTFIVFKKNCTYALFLYNL